MTDVFGMFPHFDTNNNTAANSSANNFTANRPNANDKGMLQLNNYSSIDYGNQNLYGFQDESANCYYNQYRMQTEEQSPPHKTEIIHSGHFMVSEIDKDDEADNEPNAEEEAVKDEKSIKDQQVKIKAINQSCTQFNTYLTNKPNRRSQWDIGYPKLPSLDSLFKKMNLGHDSKLTSPKWKQFKGMKISLKAKIRVNNLIWRAWHFKYVLGRTPPINPFPLQLDTDQLETSHYYISHRPEVMKMGKYLGQDFIALEYTKWRRYYKEMIQKKRNQMNSMNQFNCYDAFSNNQFDNSNDQFNMTMFNTINNYSSAQLGMQAEFMQPDFSYGIQPEFMDTFEDPCLQSFLTQKNSFLPPLIEEEPIQESPKIQEMPSQSIYSSTDTMNADLNANYDQQQMQQTNQMNSRLNGLQQQTVAQSQLQSDSPVNYNYMNYQPQQQTMIQNQQSQSQMSLIAYRQNYLPSNNLIVDQQNATSNQSSSTLTALNQTSVMLPIDQNQLSNNGLNGSNQVNNGQFVIPKPVVKQKIRSRSVSSLPKQQQVQLQRQHMIENSSSLMEINNQPMLDNQTNFHNTTSNLLSTQQQADNLQNSTSLPNAQSNLSAQNSLSNLEQQMIAERANNYVQRRNALAQSSRMQQQQTMQQSHSNQLQQSATGSNYYNMNLNEVNNMNSINNQNGQQSNASHPVEFNNRTSLRNTTTNSPTYYNQLQINSNQTVNQTNSTYNQQLNQNYQTSSNDLNTGTNLISQLLSTNNSKLAANLATNLNSQTNGSFKRNSTGTYPAFQQYASSQEQFTNNTITSSSSVTNLVMNSTNVNTNLNSGTNSSSLNTNELTSYQSSPNQLIRKSNLQSNQTFSFNRNSTMNNTSSINQSQLLNAPQLNNDLHHQSSKPNPSANLNSSLENLNKSLSTKSHRIKREHHPRKLSTGKMRTCSSSLSRSNSTKSINAHSPVSPTASLQSSLLNQTAVNKQLNASAVTNDFLNFDRTPNLLLTNSVNLNSSSLSSTPTLQSPLANNSPFTSNQNDYPNDSSGIYNANSFAFMNQNLSLNGSTQMNKSSILKSASQSSNNSSTNSNNLSSSPLASNLIKHERDPNLYREHRRVCHINAEQKRRCNIKHGFDTLRAILPSISSNNNTKISKAAMLQKGAEHIRQLRIEHEGQNKEIEALRAQIEALNQTIGIFQNQLPATGAPVSGMRPGQIKERFEGYVRDKTQQNWKFWMFSIIMEPLLDSYNNTIPTTNFDELTSSVLRWLDQSCNLINLRREVLRSLRIISTSTNVLTDPASLSAESISKVTKKHPNKKK